MEGPFPNQAASTTARRNKARPPNHLMLLRLKSILSFKIESKNSFYIKIKLVLGLVIRALLEKNLITYVRRTCFFK